MNDNHTKDQPPRGYDGLITIAFSYESGLREAFNNNPFMRLRAFEQQAQPAPHRTIERAAHKLTEQFHQNHSFRNLDPDHQTNILERIQRRAAILSINY